MTLDQINDKGTLPRKQISLLENTLTDYDIVKTFLADSLAQHKLMVDSHGERKISLM